MLIMEKYTLLVLLACFIVEENRGFNINVEEQEKGNLLAVVTLLRHGDRAPYSTFPNDQYFNLSYWPMGHGQLTDKGKRRLYKLGRWLRRRYNTFLSEEYVPKEIYVRSTDVDRCLLSASIASTGLYPQVKSTTWDHKLQWQQVPVHTKPFKDDDVLSMRKECSRYTELYQKASDTEYYKNITRTYADFFTYVSEHSGWNSTDIGEIRVLQTILDIYKSYNETFVPSWAYALDRQTLSYLAGVTHERYTHNLQLKRLVTGPFWANLFAYFDNIVDNVTGVPKFIMLVSHDTTTVAVLNSMDAFDFSPPVFAATLVWELRKTDNGEYYVNVLYKRNDPRPEILTVKGCDFNCPYADFKTILEPVTVESAAWELECASTGYLDFIKRGIDKVKSFWFDSRVDGIQKPFHVS